MGGGAGGGFGNTSGGRANAKIQKDRQDKHVVGTKNYNQQIANGKTPSILTGNATKLLSEVKGQGRVVGANKLSVDFGRIIGKYYDKNTGKYYNTSRATIHYDSKGNAHIVPARPNNF